jgi:hypothetical protein
MIKQNYSILQGDIFIFILTENKIKFIYFRAKNPLIHYSMVIDGLELKKDILKEVGNIFLYLAPCRRRIETFQTCKYQCHCQFDSSQSPICMALTLSTSNLHNKL